MHHLNNQTANVFYASIVNGNQINTTSQFYDQLLWINQEDEKIPRKELQTNQQDGCGCSGILEGQATQNK